HTTVPLTASLIRVYIGPPASVDYVRHTHHLFVHDQHLFAGGELFDDRLGDVDSGAVHARDDVLGRALAAGDDVDVHLEAGAGHADRSADAVLFVDDEILRQHVQALAAGRQRPGLAGLRG